MNNKGFSTGDTIVEVIFAVAIFSLVAVCSLLIMNQGVSNAQKALEITMVRQEIDAQAEALRFINASYIHNYQSYSSNQYSQLWNDITTSYTNTSPSTYSDDVCPTSLPARSFILNAKKAIIGPSIQPSASTFSRVVYSGDNATSAEGIWIEAVKISMPPGNSQDNADYIDFHIRACWDGPGQSTPTVIGTIVRLYEPKG